MLQLGGLHWPTARQGPFYTGEPKTQHKCQVDGGGGNQFPGLAGDSLPNAAQESGSCLCCKGALTTHDQIVVHQDPQGFLCRTAFKLAGLQHVLLPGAFSSQVRDLTAPVVEFHEIPVQPVHIPLTGSPVSQSTSELAGSALCPTLVLRTRNGISCRISPQGMPLVAGHQQDFELLAINLWPQQPCWLCSLRIEQPDSPATEIVWVCVKCMTPTYSTYSKGHDDPVNKQDP